MRIYFAFYEYSLIRNLWISVITISILRNFLLLLITTTNYVALWFSFILVAAIFNVIHMIYEATTVAWGEQTVSIEDAS